MNYKGKAITGSTLLTILGVVCFATMIVAAATLLGTITIGSKTVNDTGLSPTTVAFSTSADPDYLVTTNPVKNTAYDFATQFTATGPDAAGWYKVTVSGTGVTSLSSVVLKYWTTGPAWSTAVVGTYGSNSIEFDVHNSGWGTGTITQGFEITLVNAGDFAVTVDVMTGA